ncbi:MAG: hypothetical protein HYT73_00870 [Candidatus Aenigmarchaeota archaeon]|nr:hypothetical protein [Candidatus Aenigmarchaeota archaeon]
MMEDRMIKIISLSLAVIGIAGLAIISVQNDYSPTKIYEISDEMIGKNIIVNGTVLSSRISDGNSFMYIEDLGTIKIVMFNAKIRADIGDKATVYGRVNVYKNELEIVAEKIVVGDS